MKQDEPLKVGDEGVIKPGVLRDMRCQVLSEHYEGCTRYLLVKMLGWWGRPTINVMAEDVKQPHDPPKLEPKDGTTKSAGSPAGEGDAQKSSQ